MVSATPEILPLVGSLSTKTFTLLSVAAAVIIFFGACCHLSKTLRIVDVPGHPRIRDQFREHLRTCESHLSRNAPAVAEHLHHVLHAITSLPPSQPTPKVLVLAHKADLVKAGASSSSVTEIAISRRRASQTGGVGVESMDAESESELGGLECVDFIGTWVEVGRKNGDQDGLRELKDWLEQLIH
ncbi:hypothetical protein BKA83DRAFT_4161361 [Pisolithus microcarpus]|nr:hypothetical protein BKA83DRAFT_4161361 [Pisolithus microcarpus]